MQVFDLLSNRKQNLMHFVMLEDVILISLRDLKTKLCKHNQKEGESVNYINI